MGNSLLVAFMDPKASLLYHKEVILLSASIDTFLRLHRGDKSTRVPYHDFLPRGFRSREFKEAYDEACLAYFYWWLIRDRSPFPKELAIEYLKEKHDWDPNSINARFVQNLEVILIKHGLRDATIDVGREDELDIPGHDPVVSLLNTKIIDTRKISWIQLLEFRKDENSFKKLIKFKAFFYANYAGRSPAFIEDDILARTYAYEDVISRWGFDTYEGSLNLALNSKTLGATATASFATVLLGAPIPAILAAAAGAAIEIGKLALHVRGRKVALRRTLEDNPISYIVAAKRLERSGFHPDESVSAGPA